MFGLNSTLTVGPTVSVEGQKVAYFHLC